jgi:hypothetical protein
MSNREHCFGTDYDTQIDEIMDYFNFAKVALAMKALNWKWEGEGVPSEPQLRQFARNQLRRLANEPRIKGLFCCGFLAEIDEVGNISLTFILEQWRV